MAEKLTVLKFGGTSMGTAASMTSVRTIVRGKEGHRVVVVSALSGVTDLLLRAAREAAQGDQWQQTLETIRQRHADVAAGLFGDPGPALDELRPLLTDLESLLKGVALLRELSRRSVETISGFGEQLSSRLLARFMPEATLVDTRPLIRTDFDGARNVVVETETDRRLQEAFHSLPEVAIMPGFISTNMAGEPTTLGRGGSDYTAALVAAALGAQTLEIWTDVDGFMSADPRIISSAYKLDHLTYQEAMELSHFGAKVIYPPTILPAFNKRIPIYILNTFNPGCPGTLIDDRREADQQRKVRGISSIRDVSLLTFQMIGMVGISGFSSRLFGALADGAINIILIAQASSEISISFVVESKEAERAVRLIEREFRQELSSGQAQHVHVKEGMAIVAAVGGEMRHNTGVSGRLFDAVGKNGVNVYAIAQGATEVNISFVVREQDLRKTLNTVHDTFFLSRCQTLRLFLAGVGTVGGKLLEKLALQEQKLRDEYRLEIRLVGVANSRQHLIDIAGIPPAEAKRRLTEQGKPSNAAQFCQALLDLNVAGSVFVDCTASPDVAGTYDRLLDNNVNVVTANKIASSSAYAHYRQLKRTAQDKGARFHYETNVGAALPIIAPIADLIRSGDHIRKMEAVLSGTLNYICSRLSSGDPLSAIVRDARQQGYSEPDPRVDLAGTDVARKILILAREAGFPLEMTDIDRTPFVPDELLNTPDVDTFLARLTELDEAFAQRCESLRQQGKRLRYVATLDNGQASTGFKEVDENDPLYHLEATNNIVLITSDNYNRHPLEIKGYGAGADVTATGVFADIIKVANLT